MANPQERAEEYGEALSKHYLETSLVARVSTPQPVNQYDNKTFGVFHFPGDLPSFVFTDDGKFLDTTILSRSMASREKEFLFQRIKETSKTKKFDEFSIEGLIENIEDLTKENNKPDCLWMPMKFRDAVIEWNKTQGSGAIDGIDRSLHHKEMTFSIIWDNKYFRFDGVLFTKKENIIWKYYQDEDQGDQRINIKFDLENIDGKVVPFVFRQIAKVEVVDEDATLFLETS